jgi:hypothetical protein
MESWQETVLIDIIVLLLILFYPIKYRLSFSCHQQFKVQAVISYGFLLKASVARDKGATVAMLRVFGIPWPRKSAKKPRTINKRESQDGVSSLLSIKSFFGHKAYRPMLKMAGRMVNNLKPERFAIVGKYGFYEPQDTAWLNIILSLMPSKPPQYVFNLEPAWDEELLDMEGWARGSFSVAAVIFNLLAFIFTPATLRFLRDIRNEKKQHKINKTITQPLG